MNDGTVSANGINAEGVYLIPIVAISTEDGQAIDAVRFGIANI